MPDEKISQPPLADEQLSLNWQGRFPPPQSVASSPEAGMVLQLADGNIVASNRSAERILGLTTEQIHRMTALQSDGSPLPAETHPAMVALRTGKPCRDAVIISYKPNGELVRLLIDSQPLFLAQQITPYAVVSTFTEIPEEQGLPAESISSSEQLTVTKIKQQRTVLIVDDFAIDRETYRRYLLQDGKYNYTIWEAETGEAGLSLCQQHQPDAIILDYQLPDLDGLEFLELLSQDTKKIYQSVIMLTGQGNESIAVQAMKAGASDYLVKGRISSEDLRLAVNGAIDKARLRAQLQQSEERLQLALEAAAVGIWEWKINSNSFLFSPHIGPLFGLPKGSSIPNYEAFLNFVHPEDRENVVQAVTRALEEGGEYNIEYRIVGADGIVRWVNAKAQVYFDYRGQPLRMIGTAMDITKSKQAQEERQQQLLKERLIAQIAQHICESLELNEILNKTVARVRQFLECDRVIIFQMQPDGSGTVVTESVSPGSRSILSANIYDPCFVESYVEPYRQGLVTAKPDIYNGSIEQCHVDLLAQFQVRANLVVPILQGEQLWGLLIAHQCWTPRQWQPLEIDLLSSLATQVGIAIQQSALLEQLQIELAEKAQAEKQRESLLVREQAARAEAETANRIKDEFLAVLSHELRSPLNPILGWSKLLQRGGLPPAKAAEALNIIERNAKLQAELIEDLLDVSRILRGKLKLEVSPVNLESTILAALETVSLAAEAKPIAIQTVLTPNLSPVAGDASRLQQVVWNLLSNAIKFTPSGGRVEIRLEKVGNCAQLQVIDTGKGINPDFLPYVFDYFRQADSTTTRKFGGLGLGLAIVKHLVELHGGAIAAASPGEGQGATFTLRLPLMTTHPQIVSSSQQSAQNQDLTGIKVLVVEDDVDSREFTTFVLQQYGAQVIAVPSALAALEALIQSTPDVLVSDIGMPEMDGYMLLRQIRASMPEQCRQIPAIALTAYAGEFDQKQALSAGFQMHIPKPVEPEKLVTAVAQLVRR
jgi:PAS domain S-box-containing protein